MKKVISLLVILLIYTGCVKVDEEVDLGNQHIGEGNWTQITNLVLDDTIFYNLDEDEVVLHIRFRT